MVYNYRDFFYLCIYTMKKTLIILSAILFLASCGHRERRSGAGPDRFRPFPPVQVPTMITDHEEVIEFRISHYWDGFFQGGFHSGPESLLGVKTDEVEGALSTYIAMLSFVPKERGQQAMLKLFSKMEEAQMADTTSHIYTGLSEMVVRYLYDPNSPYRDEDLYLPFVKKLAESPLTSDNIRQGYAYEASMCSLNRFGTKAADFAFTDSNGKLGKLYAIHADYTLLFFSNPGCPACKEIMEALCSPQVEALVQAGRLAILSMYIDLEIEKWREYLPDYPSSWIRAYDHLYQLREDQLYNVRAIPMLYLLDSEKRVLLKDAPVEKVIEYLNTI